MSILFDPLEIINSSDLQLFYSTNIQDDKIFLSIEESNHAKNVLRLKDGDLIKVIDGKGSLYECKIIAYKAKLMELDIITCNSQASKHLYNLHIAIAPTKNIDRIEWFVEKATEIGIDEISFLQTHHSERKHINIERMQKIAIAAMKQSVKRYLPVINEMQKIEKFISDNTNIIKNDKLLSTTLLNTKPLNTKLFIAHLEDDRKLLKNLINPSFNHIILIGPEGDFSASEISMAYQYNYEPVSLGNYRLRTETAGVVACSTVSLMV